MYSTRSVCYIRSVREKNSCDCCGQKFRLCNSLGKLNCNFHPGTWKRSSFSTRSLHRNGYWSCCQNTEFDSRGCAWKDHHDSYRMGPFCPIALIREELLNLCSLTPEEREGRTIGKVQIKQRMVDDIEGSIDSPVVIFNEYYIIRTTLLSRQERIRDMERHHENRKMTNHHIKYTMLSL